MHKVLSCFDQIKRIVIRENSCRWQGFRWLHRFAKKLGEKIIFSDCSRSSCGKCRTKLYISQHRVLKSKLNGRTMMRCKSMLSRKDRIKFLKALNISDLDDQNCRPNVTVKVYSASNDRKWISPEFQNPRQLKESMS